MPDHAWLSACSLYVDPSSRRPAPGILVGGMPTRVFRLTRAGEDLVDEVTSTTRVSRLTPGATKLLLRMIRAGMIHPLFEPAPIDRSRVSVVIPAHDHGAHVADAVQAGSALGPVIVVDDASDDETIERAAAAGAHVIRLGANVGPSAARNMGAEAGDNEFIVFIDADCVPDENCLRVLLAHFADPEVGAVAPRILGHRAPGRSFLDRYEQARSPIDMGAKPSPVRPDARVSFVPTATIAVRRAAFEEVDGFDRELRFGEDVDFVWRLVRAGWQVRYESRVVARHHHRRRLFEIGRRRWAYGTSAGPLARRHPAALAAIRTSPWTLGAWLGLLAGRGEIAVGLLAWSWIGLYRATRHLPGAGRLSGRLVMKGFLGATRPLASALTRSWAPLTLVVTARSPRLRRRLLALVIAGKLLEWLERGRGLNPIGFTALAVADDLAFCGGVLEGCARSRVVSPLIPRSGRPRIGPG